MAEIYEVLRFVNVGLYGAILSGVIMHWRHLFDPEKVPGGRGWFVGWVAVAMYSTIEVLFLQQPAGPRVLFATVVLAGFTWSLYVRPAQHLFHTIRESRRNLNARRAEGS